MNGPATVSTEQPYVSTDEPYVPNPDDPPSAGVSYWLFDNALTLVGVPIGLQVLVDGEWIDPVSADQAAPMALNVFYDTVETLDGKPLRIIAPPGGIVQANDIELPQNGTVQAP